MTAKQRLWQYLITHNRQAYNYELAGCLVGNKGYLAWGQIVRDLRKDLKKIGKDLLCEKKEGGVYLYRIEDGKSTT